MPALWKIGEIVPVQKKPLPKVDNDLRPVTLTAILAKYFERALLPKITTHTQPVMDKMQFAYQANRSTDDAIITLIHEIAQHLDGDSTYARSLFIGYSSAFNTMQPHILISRLAEYNIPARLQLLVLDFLTNRQQYVRTECEISSTITIKIIFMNVPSSFSPSWLFLICDVLNFPPLRRKLVLSFMKRIKQSSNVLISNSYNFLMTNVMQRYWNKLLRL